MKNISSLLLLLLIPGLMFSQNPAGSVSGKVTSKKSAVENISVSLLRAKDSSLVQINLSDKNGVYYFKNLYAGKYFISASGVGFKTQNSALIDIGSSELIMEAIELATQSKLLTGVNVVAKKPMLEMRADKMLVNVDASATNAGNTALEVLEKSPGVSVDKDGNISLKGKQGVMVLVDGRPSYLDGAQLAEMLRGMSASQLDQIEIMTNPPAKYDAAGNAGVINIKTKKLKNVGFNGSINTSYGQGVYPKANAGINLNYRKNQLNVFGAGNYGYREGYQDLSINRNVIDQNSKDVLFTFDQKASMTDSRNNHSYKIGADYDFTKRTFASIVFNGSGSKMKFDNNIRNTITDGVGQVKYNVGHTFMTPATTNYNLNVNLTHKFDSAGTELTVNGAYINYKDAHHSSFTNSFFDLNGNPESKPDTLLGNLPTGFNIYAVKADFTKPLSNSGSFELGGKASFVSSDNNVRFDSIMYGNLRTDLGRTNHFIYDEKIYAGYANFNKSLGKKWKMQAGLRYEYTEGKGESLTNGTQFKNNYGKFFPTLYLSYALNAKNQINLNYGRRITRPQYSDMNPFILIIDRYTFQKGNPYLQPQFSHNIELSHMYDQFLTTTLNYSRTNGVISEILEANEQTKEATVVKRNIAKRQQVGLAVNFQKPVAKWLTMMSNVSVFNYSYQGVVNDTTVNLKTTTGNFWASAQFKFKNGWDAELNGFFNTRALDGVSMDESMGMFSVATSKSILKNKGKLSLNVRDPFTLMRYKGYTKLSTIDAKVYNRWDNRAVTISFNYRFGKQFKTNKRADNSASEEQGRVGKN